MYDLSAAVEDNEASNARRLGEMKEGIGEAGWFGAASL